MFMYPDPFLDIPALPDLIETEAEEDSRSGSQALDMTTTEAVEDEDDDDKETLCKRKRPERGGSG